MVRRSTGRRFLMACGMACALLALSACMTPGSEIDRLEQEAALARWNQCLDREAAAGAGSLEAKMGEVEHRCDGHRRDVVDTFPPHLQEQLRRLLTERGQRRLAGQLHDVMLEH